MQLPDVFHTMPALYEPSPEKVVITHAVRSDAGQAAFFRLHQYCGLPPHCHGAQWDNVLVGNVALTIDRQSCRHGPGMSSDFPAGVEHAVSVQAGAVATGGFAEADRYRLKGR